MMKRKNGNEAKYLLPTGIVAGVFYHLPKKLLSNERKDIHLVFYKMRLKGLSVLVNFHFDLGDTFPYSNELEQAVSNLLTSEVLWSTGSNHDKFEWGDGLERYFEVYVRPGLSEKQINELRQIAKALSEFCD